MRMEITSEEFMRKLSRELAFRRFDVVIGLGRGGVIPGAISAELIKTNFGTIHYELYGEGMPPPRIRGTL
ncbi:MAG: hypothetical protein NT157_03700 [Candidatus Micrarchaeota archaeon]|nr:hypothetical protein [Candidatus Micrarchaeota archaeon]